MSEVKAIEYDSNARVAWSNRERYRELVRPDIAAQVAAQDNDSLFYNHTLFAGGDDYDGCYTVEGQVVWDELHEELCRRLMACGFLAPEDEDAQS